MSNIQIQILADATLSKRLSNRITRVLIMSAEEVKKLANEEVDNAITIIRNFSNLFRNETIDQKHSGIERNQAFI